MPFATTFSNEARPIAAGLRRISLKPNWTRNAFVYLLIIVAAVALFLGISPMSNSGPKEMDMSTLAEKIKAGEVKSVVIRDDNLTVTTNDEEVYRSHKDTGASVFETLRAMGVTTDELRSVQINVAPPSQWGGLITLLGTLLPLLLVGGCSSS